MKISQVKNVKNKGKKTTGETGSPQKCLGLFGWQWLRKWLVAVELNIMDRRVGNGFQAGRMSIAHSTGFQST